ncbi:uncharacterized protein HMPREF1541_04176 [Cyphellophora europaea CBS 101466]|uniref:Glutamine amidotransferase domain-containing protein n=1 Tax=Cyphellophora europaea (strain CBS 101466) TaxID=1220924 RepID=W2S0X3_CYPE1|nr:uncharacterized protein HMPREF1541_04176 [Cyphellophora europaea CBS 101466]ETN42235.1 hypothetical protein HMPREF1541_04176 [Cyphellophora europaea CBS 101466]
MPSPPIRLGILECDTPLPNTKARFGGYGGVFEFLLKRGARALQDPQLNPDTALQITKWQVEQDPTRYPSLDDVDAILITGSKHDSFADNPWTNTLVEYTAKVLAQDRVRVIGVCFGHQIVARAMGVEVGRNDGGWEAAVTEVQLTAKGKEIFRTKGDKLAIHQMHRDIVYRYPPGVESLGHSPVCKVQGMYAPRRLLTVQGHPEFSQEIMDEILDTRHKTGIFDDAAYDAHMKKVNLEHDGVLVSQAFLRFLLED